MHIDIDISNWSRWAEVSNYAAGHGISIAEAIEELVNSGLSHDTGDWL